MTMGNNLVLPWLLASVDTLMNATFVKSLLSSAIDNGLNTFFTIAVAFVRLHDIFFDVFDSENISWLSKFVQSKELKDIWCFTVWYAIAPSAARMRVSSELGLILSKNAVIFELLDWPFEFVLCFCVFTCSIMSEAPLLAIEICVEQTVHSASQSCLPFLNIGNLFVIQ